MSYPQSVIKNIYLNTPDIIADLIASEEMLKEIEIISQQYHLQPDQRNLLGNEITLGLIGVISRDKFAHNIENELKISGEIAKQIASAVDSRIISKIPRDVLAKQEELSQVKLKMISEVDEVEKILEPIQNKSEELEKVSVPEVPPVDLPMVESAHFAPPHQADKEEREATEEPIVITAETKEEALKELSRRSMKNQNPPTLVPELAPSNLPMIEPPSAQIEPKALSQEIKSEPKVSLPDYRYEGGGDPYREPLV